MITSNIFLVDVLTILPEELDLYIQAPSLEDDVIRKMMSETEFAYYKLIKVNNGNRNVIINRIKDHFVREYFQSIEIKVKGKLVFEGYDGAEFGIFSNCIIIPNWFKEQYFVKEFYSVSNEW
jgi:hypothetical protein